MAENTIEHPHGPSRVEHLIESSSHEELAHYVVSLQDKVDRKLTEIAGLQEELGFAVTREEHLFKRIRRYEDAGVTTLRNGAVCLGRKPLGDGPHAVVLAYTGSVTPYVTWEEYHHPGQPPATGSGHYFRTFVDAVQDFLDR